MTQRKVTSVTLILLLICATCIAPALAGATIEVTTDGVHLTQSDDSPTKLDANYYRVDSAYDFVVDGNQNYWVRIGSVKAKELTTVWWSSIVAWALILVLFFAFLFGWMWTFIRLFPATAAQIEKHPLGNLGPAGERWSRFKLQMRFMIPVFLCIGFLFCSYPSNLIKAEVTHIVCDGYVDLKASDGTILFPVNKTHPDSNSLFARSGLNLSTMTHLSCSGEILNPRPWSGSIHDLGIVSL